MNATMTKREIMLAAIADHGQNVLAIFPKATERDPVALCKKLRRLELQAAALALRCCNDGPWDEAKDRPLCDAIVTKVNKLLGNVNEYQPKTGAKCGCKHGVQRDNCSNCEGTGYVIDFAAIRASKPLVPIFLNLDARGYSLKIDCEWMRANRNRLYRDWGGYGILAPDLSEGGGH